MSSNSYHTSHQSDHGSPHVNSPVWPMPAIEPPFSPRSIYDHSAPRSFFSGSTTAPYSQMDDDSSRYLSHSLRSQGYRRAPTMVSSPLARSASYSYRPVSPLTHPSAPYQQPPSHAYSVPQPPSSASSVSSGRTLPGTPGFERSASLGYSAPTPYRLPGASSSTPTLRSDSSRSTPISDMTLVNKPSHWPPRPPSASTHRPDTSRSSSPLLSHLVSFGTPGAIQHSRSLPSHPIGSPAFDYPGHINRSISYDAVNGYATPPTGHPSNASTNGHLASPGGSVGSSPTDARITTASYSGSGTPRIAYLGIDAAGYPRTAQVVDATPKVNPAPGLFITKGTGTTQRVAVPGMREETSPSYDYEIRVPPGGLVRVNGKKYRNGTDGVVVFSHHKKVSKEDGDEDEYEEGGKKRRKRKGKKEEGSPVAESPWR